MDRIEWATIDPTRDASRPMDAYIHCYTVIDETHRERERERGVEGRRKKDRG